MPLSIPPAQRLEILQRVDHYRKWYSLADERVCVLCDRVITGREIEITRDDQDVVVLRCPTQGCDGTPDTWFHLAGATVPAPAAPRRAEFSFLDPA